MDDTIVAVDACLSIRNPPIIAQGVPKVVKFQPLYIFQ
jgi:hypothetical protein